MKKLTSILALVFCLNSHFVNSQIKFIENKGQLLSSDGKVASDVLYYGDAGNVRYLIRKNGISYVFTKEIGSPIKQESITDEFSMDENRKRWKERKTEGWRIDMNWIDVNAIIQTIGEKPLSHKLNYYTPQFPNGLIGISTFEKVLVKNIYKNIDVVFYSHNNQLKYDYIIQKGGNYKQIKFAFEGAQKIQLENDTLSLITTLATVNDFIPKCYTTQNGKSKNIKMEFKQEFSNVFSIQSNAQIENFDKLVIDPSIWITYFGGSDLDYAIDLETDLSGNIYLTGYTGSTDFPVTAGAFQTVYSSLAGQNCYLSKFNTSGVLQWSTYYSGTDYEESRGVCVDGLGFAYIVGSTYSVDFPVTVGCYQPIIAGSADAFLVKFDASGVRQFATYFGSTAFDIAHKVDKDNSNNIWITGGTTNNSFPTTAGAYDVSYNGGGNDVFVSKFSSAGAYLYGTFIGGSSQEYGSDIDFTPGFIGVTGNTKASGFPTTAGAYDASVTGGECDGFYCKFDLSGALIYSTFLGGSLIELPHAINFDGLGNAIIAGHTFSSNFPTTAGAYQTVFGGGTQDCFLSKFKNDNSIVWSTYVGNNHREFGAGVAIDEFDNIYLHSGWTADAILDFPTLDCAFQKDNAGSGETFIIKFDDDCEEICRTYLGGTLAEAVDIPGSCIDYYQSFLNIACYTEGDFPVTSGAHQTLFSGYYDIGLAKLCSISCGDTMASVANFTASDSVCISFPIQFNADAVSCDQSQITYVWTFPSGTPATSTSMNPLVSYSTPGNYTATLTVTSPCETTTHSETFFVGAFGSLTAVITPSADTVCAGTPITISSVVGAGAPPYSYQWSTGDTSATITYTPTSSGNVILIVDNSGNCPGSDTVFITVLSTPNLVLPADTCLCEGTPFTINASGGTTYNWNTGDMTSSIAAYPDSNFLYIVTSANGMCVDSDSVDICYVPIPVVIAFGDTIFTGLENYDGVEVDLLAVGTGPFTWSPSTGLSCNPCANPTATVVYTTTFTVTVTNASGCSASDDVTIVTEFDLTIPNIVTPNGDGKNDKFFIKGLPPETSINIFNRWGNLMYQASDYKNDWSTVTEGVYYYVMTTGKGKTYTGFVQMTTK